ncbi:MAG: nickel pincer cofactor biosynthesis protein LarC [Coriobacteriia bacterium]|nr:nickel pincer cofactor biosynthesis protein LarC [Coriobacteriia bacterium]
MIAYLDATSGISGDKFLAALLDAGAADGAFTTEHLQTMIAELKLPGVSVAEERVTRAGMSGLHLTVSAEEDPPHRHWPTIRSMLEESALPPRARARALDAFAQLAIAEGRVHGVDPEKVHFHEVGGADSIVDIAGVALGLDLLGIEKLVCSPVATGSGTVSASAHGVLPVPAPATLELLAGIPVQAGHATGELTTPTGAALLRVLVDEFGPLPSMIPARTGYGAGTRETPGMANVARLVLGHVLAEEFTDAHSAGVATPARHAATPAPGADERSREPVVLLETTLDHLTPEHIAFIAEELRAAGPLDVWQVPAAMKKGRLGIELRVLVTPAHADEFATRLHELTGSLGVRRRDMERTVLAREVLDVDGPWGPFHVKVSGDGASERIRPEHEDIAATARERGEAYDVVERELTAAAREQLARGGTAPMPDSKQARD